MPSELKHIMRLGTHSEKKYFKEFKTYYDALIINANMVAHTTNSMSTFLGCELSKPFIIDPQTYAFQSYGHLLQQNKSKNSVVTLKKSFMTLIENYGTLIQNIICEQKRSLKSSDFELDTSDSILRDFCSNVLKYQSETILQETSTNSEYSEYINYEIEDSKNTLELKSIFLSAKS